MTKFDLANKQGSSALRKHTDDPCGPRRRCNSPALQERDAHKTRDDLTMAHLIKLRQQFIV